jgi:hypothetical protein
MCDFKLSNSFDKSIREQIADKVVQELKHTLPNLSIDYSYESGFNLPLKGTEWISQDYGPFLNSIIKYHDSRQLRFCINNNQVIGLRFKDGIKYWSSMRKY